MDVDVGRWAIDYGTIRCASERGSRGGKIHEAGDGNVARTCNAVTGARHSGKVKMLKKTFTAKLQKSPKKGGWTYVVWSNSVKFFGTRGLVKIVGDPNSD